MCPGRNIVLVLLGWLAAQLHRRRGFVRSRMRFLWLVLVWEEMEVAGHQTPGRVERVFFWGGGGRARQRPMSNLDAH